MVDPKTFYAMVADVENERIAILNKIKESDMPLIVFGGERSSFVAKQVLEANGIAVSHHCTDAAYAAKRSNLILLKNVPYSKYNVFLGMMNYYPVINSIKNNSAVSDIFYCDFDEYIPTREFFDLAYVNKNLTTLTAVYNLLEDNISKNSFVDYIRTRISGNTSYSEKYYIDGISTYFDPSIVSISSKETFIDCGAYVGDTINDLIKVSGSDKHNIFAFEPDEKNIPILLDFFSGSKLTNARLIPKGVWKCSDTLTFCAEGSSCSSINESGNTTIDVDAIDNLFSDRKVTFIKMDIEGVEFEALNGALNTIKRCIPTLAISLYHKNEDLYKIPLLLKEHCPYYKFNFRLYSRSTYDCVLHATL